MKVIDKCKSLCEKELEKLKQKYYEAEGSYNDSGYERYWKQMQKYEAQIDELTEFMEGSALDKAEANRWKRMYNELEESLFIIKKMVNNITEDDLTSPRMAEIINRLQRLK